MNNINLICKGCNKIFIVPYRFRNRKFCSRNCYFSMPEFNPFYGKKHTDKSKEAIKNSHLGKKASNSAKENMSLSKLGANNPFYGKKHTDAVINQIKIYGQNNFAGANNPFYGKKHTVNSKEKMSTTRIEKIANGEIDVIRNSRRGFHNNIKYESYYELFRIIQLENDASVLSFSRNKNIFIAYEFNGTHRYLPDFLIKYKSGFVCVEEIKGYEREVDKIKYEAAKKYLSELNIEFRVLYKKDLFKSESDYRNFLKG